LIVRDLMSGDVAPTASCAALKRADLPVFYSEKEFDLSRIKNSTASSWSLDAPARAGTL